MQMHERALQELLKDYFGADRAELLQWPSLIRDRKILHIRVYAKKEENANPFFSFNGNAERCIRAALMMLQIPPPLIPDKRTGTYITRLWQLIEGEERPSALSALDMARKLSGHRDALIREFVFFLCHPVCRITRIAGGRRSPLVNDTEIDFLILSLPGVSTQSSLESIKLCCDTYHVSWKLLGEDIWE
jgi:hypothetical protein